MNKSEWQQQLLAQQAQFSGSESVFIDAFNNSESSNNTFVTPLLYQGLLSICGPDSGKFLQGQLTCNVNSSTLQQSILGAACNPQGRMYSSFRLITNNNGSEPGYLLRMRSNLIPLTHETLHKYSVFFKTKLHDASDEWLGLGVWGDDAEQLIQTTFKLDSIPQQSGQAEHGETAIVIRLPGDKARFECWVKAEHITDTWQAITTTASPTANHAWLLEDIRNGIAEISLETESAFNPHMVNFQAIDAISFNKGCYTGQEIVARTHYKGKSKRHTQRFSLSGAEILTAGDELQAADSDKTIATVISAALSHRNDGTTSLEALLVVNADLDNNTPLMMQHKGQKIEATPCPLPYSLNEEKKP